MMHRWFRARVRVAMLAAAALMTIPVMAQGNEGRATAGLESSTNVLITFRFVKLDGNERIPVKSYRLVVASGTPGSKLLSGERSPIPTTKGSDPDDDGDMTAFVYQNIGFLTEVRAWVVDSDRIKLMADIEDSRLRPGKNGEPPAVETRQLSVNAVLKNGVPLEVTRVEGVPERSGLVEVEARILP